MEDVRALQRLGLLRVATRELRPRLINTFILDRNSEEFEDREEEEEEAIYRDDCGENVYPKPLNTQEEVNN